MTGYTVITRESPWDDDSQERALALTEYEAGLCGCGCGRPVAESTKKQPYMVHSVTCYAGRAIEVERRRVREESKSKGEPEGWDDGLHYYAEPVGDPLEEQPDT